MPRRRQEAWATGSTESLSSHCVPFCVSIVVSKRKMRIGPRPVIEKKETKTNLMTQELKSREERWENTLALTFMVCGVTLKLAGIVLMFVTLIIHGWKFDRNALTANNNIKLDGPGPGHVYALFVLTSISLLFLSSNVAGPCSLYRRWNFAGQCFGFVGEVALASVTKNVCDQWPPDAKEWSPNIFLEASALLVLIAGGAMVYTTFYISGSGWNPLPKKRVEYLRITTTEDGVDIEEGAGKIKS